MTVYHKILLFMKRQPDLTMQQFRDYYEGTHAPLAQKYSQGVDRYIRRFVEAQPHPETGAWDMPFDVVTELWFADKAVFDGTVAYITSHIMPDDIVADEANLFDRGSFRIATVVEECE